MPPSEFLPDHAAHDSLLDSVAGLLDRARRVTARSANAIMSATY
jgi:hypothetical protein